MESTTIKKVKDIVINALNKFWITLQTKIVQKTDIVNSLTNLSTKAPLSAKQGCVLKGLVDECKKNIGDVFSEESTYSIGDYVIYENTLYKFTADKDAGAWDGTKANAVKVADELSSLNGNMTTMSANMTRMSIISGTIVTNDFSSYDQHWKGSVRFPTAFKNNSVLVTVTPSNGYVGVIVSNISKTGFDLDVVNEYNGNLSKRYMRWIAVGFI